MSRPLLKRSGSVLAVLAGAVLLGSGTARAGVAPILSEGIAPPSGSQVINPSADFAVNGIWQSVVPSAPALSHDVTSDVRLSPMFSEPDSLSPSDEPASPVLFSFPTHSTIDGPGPVQSEHVNSIPDLPALWSGITSLAGIVGAGMLKRVRRSLK